MEPISSNDSHSKDFADLVEQPDIRTLAKREKASAIIISALGDASLRVVIDVNDDPGRMLHLLDTRYASCRTVSRIAIQTQLFRMSYKEQDMSTYVDQYSTFFSQLERMGKNIAIPETHKAPLVLASIDPRCALKTAAAALRTKEVDELSWDYVTTTFINEYNAKQTISSCSSRGTGRNRRQKDKKCVPGFCEMRPNDSNDSENSDIDTTVCALAAALKSLHAVNANRNFHCDFCEKSGHTKDRCFQNPDNPSNKLPQEAGETIQAKRKRSGSKVPVKKVEAAGAFVLNATAQPPKDNRSYADSGATGHFFHSEYYFVPGSIQACEETTVISADKTPVSISKCGDVTLPFKNANICLKSTFLVTGLGYNLVSTGCLADNGIDSSFRRQGALLSLEKDDFYIGSGERDAETGLYAFPQPFFQGKPNLAMLTSLSKSEAETQLWHQRLAHLNARDLLNVHKHASGVPKLNDMEEICRACRLGKVHKLSFPGHFRHASAVGEVVHSDVVGIVSRPLPIRFNFSRRSFSICYDWLYAKP